MLVKKSSGWVVFIVFCAIAAFVAGFFISQHAQFNKTIDPSQFYGTFLDKPRALSSFVLEGIDGKPLTNKTLQGHWTLLFFGFTHCGYMCPTTMAELAKMYRLLEKQAVKPLPRVMMISIDPKRDNAAKLGYYVQAFHPDFYGAIGSEQ